LGELDRARRLPEDVLAGRRRVLGHDHPDTLRAQNNLAGILRAVGELDRARQLQEDVLAENAGAPCSCCRRPEPDAMTPWVGLRPDLGAPLGTPGGVGDETPDPAPGCFVTTC